MPRRACHSDQKKIGQEYRDTGIHRQLRPRFMGPCLKILSQAAGRLDWQAVPLSKVIAMVVALTPESSSEAPPDFPSEVPDAYAGVRQLILDALEIIRSDSFDRYFELFTEDAVWMMPSRYADVQKDEARTFYRFTDKFRFDQDISVDEMVVEGQWAFVRLSFDGYLRPKGDDSSRPLRSISRHLWVLKQQEDGRWKIARDIWNNPRDSQ